MRTVPILGATALCGGALYLVQALGLTVSTSLNPYPRRFRTLTALDYLKPKITQWDHAADARSDRLQHTALFASRDKNPQLDDHYEDDEDKEAAYGKRSLAWTKRYRRLLPYEKARKSVMYLGLRSEQDWDDYVSDGKVGHGPYLPNHPEEMYADDWVSWDEFLGVMRTYDDARNIVQNVLQQLRTMEEYTAFVKDNPGRAEGLRIPALPQIVYKEKGWRNFEHFFGCNE